MWFGNCRSRQTTQFAGEMIGEWCVPAELNGRQPWSLSQWKIRSGTREAARFCQIDDESEDPADANFEC